MAAVVAAAAAAVVTAAVVVDTAAAAVVTVVIVGAIVAAAIEAAAVVADANGHYVPIAVEVGAAWAVELVSAFRANERAIVGAWPGTIREARMRVLARLQRVVDLALLDDLARVAIGAARKEWQLVTQPDPEP